MLPNLHYVVDSFNVRVLQPEWRQSEHPGVMLLTLLQTLDVILHGLAQKALPVGSEVGECLLIQLQLSLHLYGVPVKSFPPLHIIQTCQCGFFFSGHIRKLKVDKRPIRDHFTLPHQVHFLLGLLQQRLLVFKFGWVHVLVDALVLSIRETSKRQESLSPLALEPGVLGPRVSLYHLHCLKRKIGQIWRIMSYYYNKAIAS